MRAILPAGAVVATVIVSGCAAGIAERSSREGPFTFAVIADVQYADKDGGRRRRYRESREMLRECVADLDTRDLAFVIQLGDMIDGYKDAARSVADLDTILAEFKGLSAPLYHVVGNHCLNAGREALLGRLGLARAYYDFTRPEAPGWRFVVLDGNDAGYGVVSEPQLEWLASTLTSARDRGEKVIVFCHFALLKEAARRHRMGKPQPVLDMVNSSGCVVAYFAGHDHNGGYAKDRGVHHVTVKGMVEAPAKGRYCVITVHADRISMIGMGDEESREMPLVEAEAKGQDAAPASEAAR